MTFALNKNFDAYMIIYCMHMYNGRVHFSVEIFSASRGMTGVYFSTSCEMIDVYFSTSYEIADVYFPTLNSKRGQDQTAIAFE